MSKVCHARVRSICHVCHGCCLWMPDITSMIWPNFSVKGTKNKYRFCTYFPASSLLAWKGPGEVGVMFRSLQIRERRLREVTKCSWQWYSQDS